MCLRRISTQHRPCQRVFVYLPPSSASLRPQGIPTLPNRSPFGLNLVQPAKALLLQKRFVIAQMKCSFLSWLTFGIAGFLRVLLSFGIFRLSDCSRYKRGRDNIVHPIPAPHPGRTDPAVPRCNAGAVLRGKSSLHSASHSNRLPGQTNIHNPAYSNAARPPGHGCRTGKLCFQKHGVRHRECTRQAAKKDYMPAFSYYSPRTMRKMPRR